MALKYKLAKLYSMPEASFLVDPSASGAGYLLLKPTEMTFTLSAELIDRPGLTGDLVRQPHVIGPKSAPLSFKLELKGSGTPAGDATPAIAAESSAILESALGTVVRGTGTTVGTGSTTTNIVCASSAGLAKYMMVEINGQTRFVTVITDGTHFTVDRALSAAPTIGQVVYASSLFKRANTGHKSLSFVVFRDSIQYLLSGCHAKVKLEGMTARGTGHLSVEVQAATWAVSAKGSLPAAELAGITAVRAPVVKGAPYAVAGVEELISGLDLDPGSSFIFMESTAAADSKSGIELVNMVPVGTVKPYYAAQHLTDFFAGTEQSLAFSAGDRTNGYGFYAARVQYAQPTLEDRSGLVGESFGFMVNDNALDAELCVSQF